MRVGDIYKHYNFYADPITAQLLPKYLVILAVPAVGDLVVRLITSRYAGLRPEHPPCHHGDPYPGFYLGIPGGPLDRRSWLDLRPFDDLDAELFALQLRKGTIERVGELPPTMVRAALECAAAADDTSRLQESHIRDSLAALR